MKHKTEAELEAFMLRESEKAQKWVMRELAILDRLDYCHTHGWFDPVEERHDHD